MGSYKKEKNRKIREGQSGDGMANVKQKGQNFYRSAKKAKTLSMYNDGKPQRNAEGKITKSASYQSREIPKARIEPNRKWFTNSRVISQEALSSFRDAMAEKAADPYQVLLKSNKLPMTLINDAPRKNGVKQHTAKIAVESAPFKDTFGPKAQRKRVRLGVNSLEALAGETEKMHDTYLEKLEESRLLSGQLGEEQRGEQAEADSGVLTAALEPIFNKGQSKRIWNELYKTIDASDVVIHVLDARDPLGTRCRSVEKYMKTEAPHKHLIFVLNKVDLVPTGVAAAWVRHLSKQVPTLAMHASITNAFGKGALIQLLRQFSSLHSDRKQISVGMIGYPNVGKSSIINTLRKKRVCTVAPIPGETKVWQYITLMKRIYLIDSPGIVPPSKTDTAEDILLRGVVRVENVEHPEAYIPAILERVKPRHMERTYELRGWTDSTDFLEQIARKSGRLLKGGEADLTGVAKFVINDFLRGKVPWFTPPPGGKDGNKEADAGIEGRLGRLGEMGKKRKLDDADIEPDSVVGNEEGEQDKEQSEGDSIDELSVGSLSDGDAESSEDDEVGGVSFEGFDSEEEDEEEDEE